MQLDEALAAVADPTRRAICKRLAHGAATAGQLAALFPISRPAVSQHLRVLKDAGLVRSTGENRLSAYELTPAPLAAIGSWATTLTDPATSGPGPRTGPVLRTGPVQTGAVRTGPVLRTRPVLRTDPSPATEKSDPAMTVPDARPVSYVEINSPDLPRSAAFFSQVFGWSLRAFADPGYLVAAAGDAPGVDTGMLGSPDGHPRSIPVIRVDDLDATCSDAAQHGATVVVPPFTISGVGRGCYLTDPTGVLIGLHEYDPTAS